MQTFNPMELFTAMMAASQAHNMKKALSLREQQQQQEQQRGQEQGRE
jgi:hypothetical protein